MLIKKANDIRSSEITPKSMYLNRRKFLSAMGIAGVTAAGGGGLLELARPSTRAYAGQQIPNLQKSAFSTTEKVTPEQTVTHYNNYYEFSTEKEDPASMAQGFKTRPWSITIDGAVKNKQKWDIDSILKFAPAEERIYRHRCVEGWSIVVPWVGFSLSELIKRAEPLGKAKFVEFTSIYAPSEMPGQRRAVLDWPYVEGLRMDEGWRAHSPGCAVEIRLQERESDRTHSFHRRYAKHELEQGQPSGVWVLFQREPERRDVSQSSFRTPPW